MARVVKVDLLLDVAKYLRPAREAKRETQGVAGALDDAAKSGDKTSTALDTTAKEMSDAARAAAALDRRVDELRESLRGLAVQSALGGGSVDLDKQFRAQQSALRKAMNARKVLGDAGGEGAEGFAASFVARLGPLMAKLPVGPVGVAIGAAIAIPLVPTLAAAVSGAVVGGVGIGGVIGGVTLAAKDSRVQAAGKQLRESMLGDLEDSATRFVQPTLAGITEIQSAWDDVADDLDGALAAASRYVKPLAEGVGDFVRELGPGLREAAEAAGPIVDVVSQELPELGAVLSDMFSTFAEDADEGAAALRFIFMALEDGIAVTSGTIHLFSEMYRALVHVADAGVTVAESMAGWLPFIGDQIDSARQKVDLMKSDLEASGTAGGEAGEKTEGGLRKVESAASAAAVQVESLTDAVRRMAGENISAEQANMRLEEAIERATEAGRKNNDGIDRGTEKGRANRALLVSLAEASNTASDAIYKQTNSQESANAAAERGRRKFLAAAAAMGVEKGEALRLANQLFAIPNINREVTVREKQALSAIARVQAGLGKINSKNITIGVYYKSNGDLKLPGGTQLKDVDRWGGIHTPVAMAAGGIMQAGVYPASSPPLIQFAEPETGGEAYIPRFGNRDRSLDILATAARWYGMQVGPTARAAAPAAAAPSHSPAQLAAAVRAALVGMSIQMDGRAVGVVQGRQADIYSRGA